MPAERRVAFFIPARPVRVLVLAHGFPWPDGSQPDDFLAGYARSAVRRWTAFAGAHDAVVVAPAFGGSDFGGYRALFGRRADADEFVSAVVDEVGTAHAPRPAGWLTAASEVPVSVLVGSLDTEPQPAEPGQHGSSRLKRAAGWITSMHGHARANGRAPSAGLICAAGLDHDEAAMAVPAQEIFARQWAAR